MQSGVVGGTVYTSLGTINLTAHPRCRRRSGKRAEVSLPCLN